MKLTFLNGINNDNYRELEDQLTTLVHTNKHEIKVFKLREMDIKYCIGCWDCWVKTPGECVFQDDQTEILKNIVHSDVLVFLSPIVMGYTSSVLKRTHDRLIPLVHPYISMIKGESHHIRRYLKLPKVATVLVEDEQYNDEDATMIENIYQRFSLNIREDLVFSISVKEDLGGLIDEINRL